MTEPSQTTEREVFDTGIYECERVRREHSGTIGFVKTHEERFTCHVGPHILSTPFPLVAGQSYRVLIEEVITNENEED